MKKQLRPEVPQILKDNSGKWNQQWAARRASNSSATFSWYQWEGISVRDWILPILRDMNQEHCSFCDSFPLFASTNEPIEHFRPKSNPLFYDQAFTWSNLYYSCPLCQSCKGEKWDDGLLAPDVDEYVLHDYFVFDFTTGGISPNPSASLSHQERARCTIELYGLDLAVRRRSRLLEARKWQKTGEQDIDDWAYRDFLTGAT